MLIFLGQLLPVETDSALTIRIDRTLARSGRRHDLGSLACLRVRTSEPTRDQGNESGRLSFDPAVPWVWNGRAAQSLTNEKRSIGRGVRPC